MFPDTTRVRAAVMAALVLASFPRSAHADPLAEAPLFNRPSYIGAYLGDTDARGEAVESGIGRFARMVGKRPAFVKTFHDLDVDFSERGWGGQLVRRTVAAGSTPYLALDLRFRGAGVGDERAVELRLAGHLQRRVRRARQVRGRVPPRRHHLPARGRAQREMGFQPQCGQPAGPPLGRPGALELVRPLLPGHGFVDYLGPHGYNGPSVWGGAYQTFATVFNGRDSDNILSDLEARWPRKQIIIGEFASQEAGLTQRHRGTEKAAPGTCPGPLFRRYGRRWARRPVESLTATRSSSAGESLSGNTARHRPPAYRAEG